MSETKVSFKEIREKLAGLAPMSNNSFYEFTPSIYEDIPEEYRPTFKIKQFNIEQVEDIKKIMTGSKKTKDDSALNDIFLNKLHEVLIDWDNLIDLGTGEQFKYDKTIECMKMIPQTILVKIFEECIVISGIVTRAQFKAINGQ